MLFALGGYAYSIGVNPWPWLTSREAAEAMAEQVAQWIPTYGIDGILNSSDKKLMLKNLQDCWNNLT